MEKLRIFFIGGPCRMNEIKLNHLEHDSIRLIVFKAMMCHEDVQRGDRLAYGVSGWFLPEPNCCAATTLVATNVAIASLRLFAVAYEQLMVKMPPSPSRQTDPSLL